MKGMVNNMKNHSGMTLSDIKAQMLSEREIKEILKVLEKESGSLIFNEIYTTKEKVNQKFNQLYSIIKKGFTIDEIRKFELKFKLNREDKEVKVLELRRLITNMVLWKGLRRLGYEIKDHHVKEFTTVTSDTISNYYNKYFIEPSLDSINHRRINKVLADTTYELSKISLDFNIIMGISVSLENYRNTAKKFPRFDEILKHRLDPNLSPHEVEEVVDRLTEEQMAILRQDEDSVIRFFLEAKDGTRKDALQEFIVASSNKPDLLGNTMPVPIDRNYIYGGLSNLLNYYVDAVAGRKSIILNKTEMGKSGYFAYLVILLNANTRLNYKVDDCGTTRTWYYYIKSKKHLKKLEGRYYYAGKNTLKMIKPTDEHLIGTYVRIRTPAFCACKKGICKTCYGNLSELNKDISIGGLSAIIVTMVIQQKILSSKHQLKTKSMPVIFNKEFDKVFKLFSNEIILNTEQNLDVYKEDDKKLLLIIDKKDLDTENEFDKDLTNKPLQRFYLGTGRKKSKKMIDIEKIEKYEEIHNTPVNMTEALVNSENFHYKDGMYYIELDELDDETILFTIEVENNEVTKPLYDMKNILDTRGHNGNKTVDDILTASLDCIIDGGIDVNSVSAELLIYPLIRKKDDIFSRPNFKLHVWDEDIDILSTSTAIKNNNSIVIKLSADAIIDQFKDLNTYEMTGSSYIDDFFREKLNPIISKAFEDLEDEEYQSDDYEDVEE